MAMGGYDGKLRSPYDKSGKKKHFLLASDNLGQRIVRLNVPAFLKDKEELDKEEHLSVLALIAQLLHRAEIEFCRN
jgi:hypothetical protein